MLFVISHLGFLVTLAMLTLALPKNREGTMDEEIVQGVKSHVLHVTDLIFISPKHHWL